MFSFSLTGSVLNKFVNHKIYIAWPPTLRLSGPRTIVRLYTVHLLIGFVFSSAARPTTNGGLHSPLQSAHPRLASFRTVPRRLYLLIALIPYITQSSFFPDPNNVMSAF